MDGSFVVVAWYIQTTKAGIDRADRISLAELLDLITWCYWICGAIFYHSITHQWIKKYFNKLLEGLSGHFVNKAESYTLLKSSLDSICYGSFCILVSSWNKLSENFEWESPRPLAQRILLTPKGVRAEHLKTVTRVFHVLSRDVES